MLSETTGNEVINYYYDSDGTILGIGYKKGTNDEKHYFFEKNAFGDVIAVYRNSDSVLIGTYEYDPWGNPISVKEAAGGRDTDGILGKNPFRYRCYYYDTETGFYYLNSRYYDPQIRRFISADNQLAETGASVIGYNLYAYCDNSPLGAVDYDGHFAITIAAGVTVSVGFILSVVAVGALTYMVYDYSQNPHNEQNPVAVLGNMLSDQIGSIRNAKNKKKGEKAGQGEADKGIGASEAGEQEYKEKINIKGKKPKDDIPERFRGERPLKGESGKEAAKRVLQKHGEYNPNETKGSTLFSQLKKYFDQHFE